ncbi:MAG: membrane protein insertion efficiency factor YidD [Phycisphaerales bacterium JB058]
MLAWPLILLVRAYQATLSPFLGGQCRYHPTCSHSSLQALMEYGAIRGTVLTGRRIARCHPFARGGYDPVPARKDDAMRKE